LLIVDDCEWILTVSSSLLVLEVEDWLDESQEWDVLVVILMCIN